MEDAESHPIPQDVTGFQFKIIGDITVKQFAYLASSAILTWVFYQLPIISFIRLPLVICLGGLGPALAFMPIEGRPLDIMIFNFIKALFNPTRFVYQNTGGNVWLSTVTAQKPRSAGQKTAVPKEKIQTPRLNEPLKSNLQTAIISQNNKLNEKDSTIPLPKTQTAPPILQGQPSFPRIMSMYTSLIHPQESQEKTASQPLGKIQEDKDESLKKKVLALEKDLELMKKEKIELEQKQSTLFPQQQESLNLEKQLQGVLAQKEALTKQLIALQQKLDLQKNNVFAPTMATAPLSGAKTQNVKQIPKGMGKNIGLPITPEFPNIITGIIKDPRGNPLGNILVEVKDKEGNPVRAFKTNGLGQFVSATALANGDYTVLFEDPKGQNKFDAIGFSAIGEVILPIEVTSIDEREELRKSLFRES